jgi:hypothetical protein
VVPMRQEAAAPMKQAECQSQAATNSALPLEQVIEGHSPDLNNVESKGCTLPIYSGTGAELGDADAVANGRTKYWRLEYN